MTKCLESDVSSLEFEKEYNREELEQIAAFYIDNYFRDKQIDLDNISKYIDLCVDTNFCRGIDKAYEVIEKSGKFETNCSDHLISEDIRFVIKLLSQIRKRVPQEFSAGVLLMHLELLEGIKF